MLYEKWISGINEMLKSTADLLYPRRCPLCGDISDGICSQCLPGLKPVRQPRCFRCGKPLEQEEEEYCMDCRKGTHLFCQGRGVLVYEGDVKEAVHRIKYGNKREYLDVFAALMVQELENDIRRWDPEVLVPIPMYPRKKRVRGFNQAEILADRLGGFLGLPVDAGWMKKVKDTREQKELTNTLRKQNLKGAFAAEDSAKGYRRVLLVDDVYTTGSTMDAAAEALLRRGVEEVYWITICVGRGDT